jgi:hypothetical protein
MQTIVMLGHHQEDWVVVAMDLFLIMHVAQTGLLTQEEGLEVVKKHPHVPLILWVAAESS